jgi:phospholipase A-2-activating protein
VDKSKIPGVEVLSEPGKKDQDVIMVRNGNTVEAHQWSLATGTWTKLGEVVDAVGSSRKQVFDGREYDFVFDVDLGTGAPLKLPFNVTGIHHCAHDLIVENPWQAAQNFIDGNELAQGFLDQIANFIIQNTKGVALAPQAAVNPDPYTGSRYTPQVTSQASAAAGWSNPDPYTGSAASAPSTQSGKILPLSESDTLSFKMANLAAIQKKILDVNGQVEDVRFLLEDYGLWQDIKLTAIDVKTLEKLSQYLQNPQAAGNSVSEVHAALVFTKLLQWPITSRFPGLDLLRLLVLTASPLVLAHQLDFLGFVATQAQLPDGPDANVMLALRCFANMFVQSDGANYMISHRRQVILQGLS